MRLTYGMTLSPTEDLARHVQFIAVYEDGSRDVFAVPECTLDQGPRIDALIRIVAREWQRDGLLKPGKIVGVYQDPASLYS